MRSEGVLIKVGFVLLCLIWGSTWMAIKIGLESVPPFYGIFFRFLLAAIILLVIMKLRGIPVPRDRTTWKLFTAIGFLSLGLPFSIIYWAEQFLPSGLMSILFAVFPFMVAIFSHIVLPEEPLNVYKVLGIVVGFLGICVIFSSGLTGAYGFGEFGFFAMAGVIVSTVFQAGSVMIVKKKAKHVNPIVLNFGGMLVATVPVIVLAVSFERFSDIRLDTKTVGSIVYLATFGSVVTFVIYYWLLKRLEAVFLSFLTFITPIVAVILGAVVLGESMEPNTFLGASLVLVGILLSNARGLYASLVARQRKK